MLNIDYTEAFKLLCQDLDIPKYTVTYCLKRIKCEGLTFLTVTLPKLASFLLASLECGNTHDARKELTCFQWKRGALLHFEGLTDTIFDINGCVRADADAVSIWKLRQFSQYLYKLSLPFTDEQLAKAESDFLKVEDDLKEANVDDNFVDQMRKNVESNYTFDSYTTALSNHRPRLGPGTFSNSSRKNGLPYYRYKISNDVLHSVPLKYEAISGYFKPSPGCSKKNSLIQGDTSNYSEVLYVPKDSRGPRVIMREPLHALRLQLSFFDFFSRQLTRQSHGRINFTDQTVNQKLASLGSKTGEWATIDLKEASDRVSYKVVRKLCSHIPTLRYFLKMCRTKTAKLPSGKFIQLEKLAGMGSGLTFVWLSFIIHTAVSTEIANSFRMSFKDASKYVYTYGDDLIVPTRFVSCVKTALDKVALVTNVKKSFTKLHANISHFRESCGGDYYNGYDVGINRLKLSNSTLITKKVTCIDSNSKARVKYVLNASGSQVLPELNAHAALLALDGFNNLSKFFYDLVKSRVGRMPYTRHSTSLFCEVTRKYFDYPQDEHGNYANIRVKTSGPILELSPEQSDYYQYSKALSARTAGNLEYLSGDSLTALPSDVVVTPRVSRLKRVNVSTLSLLG